MQENLSAYEIKEKVLALQEAMLSAHPQMPGLLRQIHTQLRADPAIETLLSEDEIGIIISGLMIQTQTELICASVKSKTKSLKSMGTGDL